jgi:hypothetical protein
MTCTMYYCISALLHSCVLDFMSATMYHKTTNHCRLLDLLRRLAFRVRTRRRICIIWKSRIPSCIRNNRVEKDPELFIPNLDPTCGKIRIQIQIQIWITFRKSSKVSPFVSPFKSNIQFYTVYLKTFVIPFYVGSGSGSTTLVYRSLMHAQ